MKNILVVHQSAELYGSDRVLLALVSALDRDKYHPIVLLPSDGPLLVELNVAGVECHVVPISRLSRATLSLSGLLMLPVNLAHSMSAINRVLNGRRIDLVHSNTLAVLSGAVWARWHRTPHLWHVHEIILHPRLARKIYAQMLSWFADCVVCISQAVRENLLQDQPKLDEKIKLVWNGLRRIGVRDEQTVRELRQSIGVQDDELIVALVGRINRWKGQLILVQAAELLWQQGVRNLRFLIVGSPPEGQEHFLVALQQSIDTSIAKQTFVLMGFTQDVWSIWDSSDIAVIPSTEPEPFGMVALEAMAAGKPVVAANHGGLSEIVVDGKTGFLVQPGDVSALAEAILKLSGDNAMRLEMGAAGLLRYESEFTLEAYCRNFVDIYDAMILGRSYV